MKMSDDVLELLEDISTQSKRWLEIMEKHNIKIDSLDDKMQKLVFTFYSRMVHFGNRARSILEV